jgi:response regulator of citrate/malate metabolism
MDNQVNLIMLVDDNQLTNTINERILMETKKVRRVLLCKSAENAIDQLIDLQKSNQAMPDIIFLDIVMPKSNGWEFLDLYKEHFGMFKPNSVVMLTSSADVSHLIECTLHPEIQDFIIKPLTDVETHRIIKQHTQLTRFEQA